MQQHECFGPSVIAPNAADLAHDLEVRLAELLAGVYAVQQIVRGCDELRCGSTVIAAAGAAIEWIADKLEDDLNAAISVTSEARA